MTRPQIPDPFMDVMVQMPSGVRLRFLTHSTVVELDVMLTMIRVVPNAPMPAVLDLLADDELAAQVRTDTGTIVSVDLADPTQLSIDEGGPTTIRFDGLAVVSKVVELWLPQAAIVERRGASPRGLRPYRSTFRCARVRAGWCSRVKCDRHWAFRARVWPPGRPFPRPERICPPGSAKRRELE